MYHCLNLWAETHMPTASDIFECYGAMLLETLELCGSGVDAILKMSLALTYSPECDGHSTC